MRLVNTASNTEICQRLDVADNFVTRLKGLIGVKSLSSGMYFPNCNWIHTFFMSIPIDVVYLDKEMKVRKVDHNLQPWRLAKPVLMARNVVELPAGTARAKKLEVGDKLHVGD